MITIRLMSLADYEEVYALWVNTPGMGLNSTDDSREGIRRYLERNPTTSFVAVCDGTIVGVIMAGHDGRRGYIYHTAVHPAYQKQGIGKKLAGCVLSALEKEGINKAVLVAFKRNAAGNDFWNAIGFEEREDLTYRNKNIRPLQRMDT